jgi:hypothetical protein
MTRDRGAVAVRKLDADQPTLGGGGDVDKQPQQSPEALVRSSHSTDAIGGREISVTKVR